MTKHKQAQVNLERWRPMVLEAVSSGQSIASYAQAHGVKVKCIQLLDSAGREVERSPWLTLGRTYQVLSILIGQDGKRSYAIVSHEHEGEWPIMGNHRAECFEVVSTVAPSNWRVWIHESSAIDISPHAWQVNGFIEAFFDHDPATYPIFVREREIMLREDP